jgi:putative ABC transport system permease protein
MILGEGFRLVAGGILAGAAATVLMVRFISSQLYGVSAADPLSLIAVMALLLMISLLACWLGARRALHVDPVVALRAD